jgi:hypothetical protein
VLPDKTLVVFFIVFPHEALCAGEKASLSEGTVTVFFDEQLRDVAEGILDIYPSLQGKLEEKLGMDTGFPHEIVLVKDAGEFRDMAGSGLIVAVAFSGQYLVVVDYTRVVQKPFTLEDTLKHELCHLALHHFVYRQGANQVEGGRAPMASAVAERRGVPVGKREHRRTGGTGKHDADNHGCADGQADTAQKAREGVPPGRQAPGACL